MKKKNLYLSTIDEKAHILAEKKNLGLEIAEFCTAWNLDDHFEETDRIVRNKISCSDRFTLHGPFSELFPSAVDPLARKLAEYRFSQTIRLAENYGIRKIIFHGGYNPKLFFPCWYIEQSEIFWKGFLDRIPENMTVCLENVLEEEPMMLKKVISAVDDKRLRLCLDVGHAHAYSKFSPKDWLEECGNLISHFHIHNNDGSWDTHSPLDCGTIPMEELLSEIDKICSDASLTLELTDGASSLEWLREKEILEE